jgi:hypothetical protein
VKGVSLDLFAVEPKGIFYSRNCAPNKGIKKKMPFANYEYFDNLGNLYQVSLPSDFAEALGLTPARGFEPYLDPTISPRFVSYRSNVPPQQRQAVIGTTSQFANPPLFLTVSGVGYQAISFQGETIPALPFNLIQAVQGPQGAPGPQGAQGPAGTIGSISNNELVGNVSGSVAIPTGLTSAQATAILQIFSSSLSGLAPASGGGTTNFLRADGSWAPAGGSSPPTVSTFQNLAASTVYTVTHGLGRLPYSAQVRLQCVTAEQGYSVGDTLFGSLSPVEFGGTYYNFSISANATTITWVTGSSGVGINNKSTGAVMALTNSRWQTAVAYT